MEHLCTKSGRLRVAVSGVGGGVGQSVMKALTISSLPVDVYPVDIHPYSAGLYRGVEAAVLPPPETPQGLVAWAEWLREKAIDAIIPGADHELACLASVRDEWARNGVCQILVSDGELVRACRDKTATVDLLTRHGFPAPASAWDLSVRDAVSWGESVGYPVVLKPRDGSASRNVHVVKDEEELAFFFHRTPRPMLQEYLSLSGKVEEFTCAVFVDSDGSPVGTFMARRELSGGSTYRAEVSHWPNLHELLVELGSVLRPRGPMNVQIRLTDRGPVPFEINIRCSGTTAIRAYFGYNEPEMMVRHYVLGEKLSPPEVGRGYALRYWNEVFLDGTTGEELQACPSTLKGKIIGWP
ncbi:MAG: ATP-grasp domain-containing protein [Desulfomonile tiedjei]|nr:ATP-grasp domain-containing protein [Desulfomonile tiedjei]